MNDERVYVFFDIAWQSEDPEGKECKLCDEKIWGQTWQMKLMHQGNVIPIKSEMPALCASCFELYKSVSENVIEL